MERCCHGTALGAMTQVHMVNMAGKAPAGEHWPKSAFPFKQSGMDLGHKNKCMTSQRRIFKIFLCFDSRLWCRLYLTFYVLFFTSFT